MNLMAAIALFVLWSAWTWVLTVLWPVRRSS